MSPRMKMVSWPTTTKVESLYEYEFAYICNAGFQFLVRVAWIFLDETLPQILGR